MSIVGGPGKDETRLASRGIGPTRQSFLVVAECMGCGERTTDFVVYDGGPPSLLALDQRRIAVPFCTKLKRKPNKELELDTDGAPIVGGCNVEYIAWQQNQIRYGNLGDDVFLHDLVRRFVRMHRPSVTFP